MIDTDLEYGLVEYNQYRRCCFNNFVNPIPNDDFDRILKARYNKISRIKKHLVYLLTHRKNHYFVTFTFSDEHINKSDHTKRRYIRECLTGISNDVLYILNIDFGSKNEREHFHCIIGTDFDIDVSEYIKTHYNSFSYVERIRILSDDIKRVSKYLNKLTNHCCKDSTKNKRVVFNFKGYDEITDSDDRFKLFTLHCHQLGLW